MLCLCVYCCWWTGSKCVVRLISQWNILSESSAGIVLILCGCKVTNTFDVTALLADVGGSSTVWIAVQAAILCQTQCRLNRTSDSLRQNGSDMAMESLERQHGWTTIVRWLWHLWHLGRYSAGKANTDKRCDLLISTLWFTDKLPSQVG